MKKKYIFELYVVGSTPGSVQAIDNFKTILKEVNIDYDLTIIDVLETPQLAVDAGVVATPTVIKKLPRPMRKIVGNLSNRDRILNNLDISNK